VGGGIEGERREGEIQSLWFVWAHRATYFFFQRVRFGALKDVVVFRGWVPVDDVL
jgi:hypothetical protein